MAGAYSGRPRQRLERHDATRCRSLAAALDPHESSREPIQGALAAPFRPSRAAPRARDRTASVAARRHRKSSRRHSKPARGRRGLPQSATIGSSIFGAFHTLWKGVWDMVTPWRWCSTAPSCASDSVILATARSSDRFGGQTLDVLLHLPFGREPPEGPVQDYCVLPDSGGGCEGPARNAR